ncbi:MAG: type VI secretion system tip protein VgrG [Burkholderiales bacterium]|nr:type VI secretion system tip protein VgrG [Burkholderiales bacterium]
MPAQRLTQLRTPLPKNRFGDEALVFRQIAGKEAINELFHYQLLAHSTRADIKAEELLGKVIHLTLEDQFRKPCHFDAVVQEFAAAGQDGESFLYELSLVPWFWLASLGSDCRCFQDKTAIEIIQEVLQDYPYGVRLALSGTFQKREFCVQYNESDFHFVCRLLESEGVSYSFEHDAERHYLVLDDFISPSRTIKGHADIPFHTSAKNRVDQEEALSASRARRRVTPGTHVSGDFHFKRPQQTMWTHRQLPKDHSHARHEVYQWPGNFHLHDHGQQVAQLRLEQQQTNFGHFGVHSHVRATAFGASGAMFGMKQHPQPEMNRRYIVLSSSVFLKENPATSSSQSAPEWRIRLQLAASNCNFRPQRSTSLPRIDGVQTAIVTTPGDEEIWTNEYGQIKVKFHWDRNAQEDGKDSCWIRVASGWGGARWGELMLPRKGQEVVVSFIDGNPDRPLVIGRVNNAKNMPDSFSNRSALQGDIALAGIKSRELSGSRYNQMLFDDTAGEIRAHLESEHGKSQLNLGFLAEPRQAGYAEPRGEGFELRSDDWGTLRAAKGILLSAEAQVAAAGASLTRHQLIAVLEQALAQAQAQAGNAAQNQANKSDIKPQQALTQALKDWDSGSNAKKGGGQGGAPVIAVSAPAGFAFATPNSGLLAASIHLDLVAEQNQHLTAGQQLNLQAGQSISQFAHSGDVKSIAHQGNHITQAQKKDVLIAANQNVKISASENDVEIIAGKDIKLICGGSYIHLTAGGIELGTDGKITMKAAHIDYLGAANMAAELPKFGKSDAGKFFALTQGLTSTPAAGQKYKITLGDGKIIEGITDALGHTSLAEGLQMHIAKIDIFGKK